MRNQNDGNHGVSDLERGSDQSGVVGAPPANARGGKREHDASSGRVGVEVASEPRQALLIVDKSSDDIDLLKEIAIYATALGTGIFLALSVLGL